MIFVQTIIDTDVDIDIDIDIYAHYTHKRARTTYKHTVRTNFIIVFV